MGLLLIEFPLYLEYIQSAYVCVTTRNLRHFGLIVVELKFIKIWVCNISLFSISIFVNITVGNAAQDQRI